jgi:hypothetical protein
MHEINSHVSPTSTTTINSIIPLIVMILNETNSQNVLIRLFLISNESKVVYFFIAKLGLLFEILYQVMDIFLTFYRI